ncbi:hypothetical protein KXQ82_04295 [Mucilaginibacter sp. HMF5004]|uniref:hypothetical protein n=1 Tax=Mucilaginibacter rivuli TaxID=2857527 RepID=UPI001C5FF571|nr:hypothetical protein [Mucilaginibacter rivuli]MBW4888917.1 hypothetical protein [Mucilaginibacter rivuli]
MTASEVFVSQLSRKSFLPFWSFPSPLRKKNKELCDVLIVCENNIIIISIKDIRISEHSDEVVRRERWQKKAISQSVDQIYGAERYLNSVDELTLNDRQTKIELPLTENRIIFRIAIAFGGENRYPLENGDFGEGFVHVFDEESTLTVFEELDTITDFIRYLKAKEKFLWGKHLLIPKEVDFLALYINTELIFNFEVDPDAIVLENNLWETYKGSAEYAQWRKEIKMSYVWDEFVAQLFTMHVERDQKLHLRSELEKATRAIALEPRMNRIELGMVLEDAIKTGVKARMLKAFNGADHSYVFMPLSAKNWFQKEKELQLRCMIARYENPGASKVIGIAIGRELNEPPIFDLVYFDIPILSDEIIEQIKAAQKQLGYFKNPVITHSKDMRKKV